MRTEYSKSERLKGHLTFAAIRDVISIQFGISTTVIRNDDIPHASSDGMFCLPRTGFIPANGDERSMTTMISNPSARGSLCFIAHHRVLLPSPSFSSSFSNCIILTREPPHIHLHPLPLPCYINLGKKTHIRERGRLRPRIKLQSNISRRARDIFRDHARA